MASAAESQSQSHDDDALQTVLQLSAIDAEVQRHACQTLMLQLQQGAVTAAQLLQLDCVPPLLRIVQQDEDRTTAESFAAAAAAAPAPTAAAAAAVAPLVLAARRVLHQLQMDSQLRLFEAGWSVSADKATGRVTYRCAGTKESRSLPPSMPPSTAPEAADEPEWVTSLLAELPLLCSPVRHADGTEEWTALVRSHRPRSLSGSVPSLSVIDVRPEAEGGAAAADADGTPAAEGVARQLLIGTWQGIGCAFRETEADLSYAPGAHLEAWYTVTIAGVGLLAAADRVAQVSSSAAAAIAAAAAPSSPAPAAAATADSAVDPRPTKRVLVIGLGGGALVSFLSHYAPHWSLDVVEINEEVARVAERWFGVRFANGLEEVPPGQADSASISTPPTPAAQALTAGFAEPSPGAPCKLHVCDAATFVRQAPSGTFDLVLLDVYTSGVFPSALLEPEFFTHLRRVLRPAASASAAGADDVGGSLLVNAGVGQDRERVWQCAAEAFGADQCRMLLDRKAASAAASAASSSSGGGVQSVASAEELAQENGVLLAGGAVPHFRERFNVLGWRKAVVERHPATLPPLPFELHSMLTSEANPDASSAPLRQPYTHVAWRGVQFDRLAARQQKQQEREGKVAATNAKSTPAPPKMASKDDAAWSLFD